MDDVTEPPIGADTYARWRASTLGRITERVEMGVVLGLSGQLAGKRVLDVGTGTGILAIATAKLGGSNILACDTDIDSVKIARENSVLNDAGEQIDFFDGSIDTATPQFDFVCANLTIDVIVPIFELLLAKAKNTLLLSGILSEQEPQIREALQKFQISDSKFEIERAGEWISVIVRIS